MTNATPSLADAAAAIEALLAAAAAEHNHLTAQRDALLAAAKIALEQFETNGWATGRAATKLSAAIALAETERHNEEPPT